MQGLRIVRKFKPKGHHVKHFGVIQIEGVKAYIGEPIMPHTYNVRYGPCVYCGGVARTVDHLVPKSKGGSNDPENKVHACKACNCAKADMSLLEFLHFLKFGKAEPPPMIPREYERAAAPVEESLWATLNYYG